MPYISSRFYAILTSVFVAGELRFNSTLFDQFIYHQSYTTFKNKFCRRGSLSVFFLPTTYYLNYQTLLHQAYKILYELIIQEEYHPFSSRKKSQNSTTSLPQEIYKTSTTSIPQEKNQNSTTSFTWRKYIPHVEGNHKKHICHLSYD